MKFVLIGIIALVVVIAFADPLYVGGTGIDARIAAALLIVVFGFLFVTVSSRLTGEIGSSSNPISGMTVATLLLTCLIFLVLGWTGRNYYVTALSIGARRLHRVVERRHDVAGPEDRLPRRRHAEVRSRSRS